MECDVVCEHTRDLKIERARGANFIWNHKYDFRPKLHVTKFNYHFVTFILKFYWLLCFIKSLSLAGKEMRFRAKNGAIRE